MNDQRDPLSSENQHQKIIDFCLVDLTRNKCHFENLSAECFSSESNRSIKRYVKTCIIIFGLTLTIFGYHLLGEEPIIKKEVWQFDKVKLKNGYCMQGLLLEETEQQVRIQLVRRNPGRPTVTFTTAFKRAEVEKIEKLRDNERIKLKERVASLDLDNQLGTARLENIELQRISWNGEKNGAISYHGDFFELIANAPEDVVKRSIVRLEQIYAVYSRFLPPRVTNARPTTIYLLQAKSDYLKLANSSNKQFLNPAFYNPDKNQIVISICDLQKVTEELDLFRQKVQVELKSLAQQTTELRKLYHKQEDLERFMQPIQNSRKRLVEAVRYNDRLFDKLSKQHYRVLYHEAFHAYVMTFVFPMISKIGDKKSGRRGPELPRWLNEGLAQIFESAIIEGNELRIGHAEEDRLTRCKELLKKKHLTPLDTLLRSDLKSFIVFHHGDRLGSDENYLTSWALAMYLLFDRNRIVFPTLTNYLEKLANNEDPVKAFEEWTNQRLPEFEEQFQKYIRQLQRDGSIFVSPAEKK